MIEKEIKRGQIYWIEPGKYGQNGDNIIRGTRPAIIISNDIINKMNFNYEVVFLSTNAKFDRAERCTIRSSNAMSTGEWTPGDPMPITTATPDRGEYTEEALDYIDELENKNHELEKELAKAKHGEEILRCLYNELLVKTLRIDNTDKTL